MPVGRVLRWLIVLGVTAAGFTIVLWITEAWIGLDGATALTLATAAAPVLASPFGWWATQPIEARSGRRRHASPAVEEAQPAGAGSVFICYSQTDARAYAVRLATHFGLSGVPAWLDKKIVTGQRWTQIIESQLDQSAAVVVVMTPAGSRSEWVDREIAHARAAGKPILPVLRAGRPFFSLSNLQYEDVTDGSLPGAAFISRLSAIIEATTTGEKLANPSPTPAVAAEVESVAQVPPAPKAHVAVPVAAVPNTRKRVLAALAVALVAVTGAVTPIVLSSLGDKNDKASSTGPAYPFTAPGLAISPDGQWLYVTYNSVVNGGNSTKPSGSFVSIDIQTKTTGAPMSDTAGVGDAVISPDGKQLYTASRYFDGVMVIFRLGANPIGIGAFDLPASQSSQPDAASEGNRGIVMSPDGSRIYVVDESSSTVFFASTNPEKWEARLVKPVKVNERPRAIAVSPDGKRLYVAGGVDSGLVSVIDTSTATVINNSISVGADPRRMAISRDGTRLYVANYGSNTISVVDTGTAQVIRQFNAGCGTNPTSVAVGRDADRVYVACEASDVVVAMDGTSGATIGNAIKVGRRPSTMVISADGRRLYVANIETSTINVTVIDTATATAIGTPVVAGAWLAPGSPSASASGN